MIENQLHQYLPQSSIDYCHKLVESLEVDVQIKKPRKTKYGDYRYSRLGKNRPLITINNDLTAENFLITLIHELAHASAYRKFSRKIKPHGPEWKSEFRDLMLPLITRDVFSLELSEVLLKHLKNPKATTSADPELARLLAKPDRLNQKQFLDEIGENGRFTLNGKQFIKLYKRRTRVMCQEIPSGKKYLINSSARVIRQVN